MSKSISGRSRKRFAAALGQPAKTDNSTVALSAKVAIRENVMAAIAQDCATPGPAVFDAFAGEGVLFRQVWHRAVSYVGCDLKWYRDERLMFVADNHRVMRAIDLSAFNVFDIDSWGSPWDQVLILAARRPLAAGERLGLVLTEGSSLKLRMGALPHSLVTLSSIRPRLDGAARGHDDIIDRALAGMCRRMQCRIVKRWQARTRTGSAMRYVGLVLEGTAQKGQRIFEAGGESPEPRRKIGHLENRRG
jgi:hypothetical protein